MNRLLLNQSKGATAAEYVIILALITGVIVTAVTTLGQRVSGLFGAATTGW